MSLLHIIILVAGTIGLIVFSWTASIRAHRYHGVFRFFAFESILVLVLFNAEWWFKDPFSVFQLISWPLLLASIFPPIHGFILLNKVGDPQGQMEETTKLIEAGLYKYIRHPMYSSFVLAGPGAFLKHVSFLTAAMVVICLVSTYLTAKVEQGEMIERFGDDYIQYMKRTRMFIPFLF
jgi:protein-S-isoprenylcysteine O-methyltransferase Ste14